MSTSYTDSGGGARSLPTLREMVDTVSHECPARLGMSAKELQAKSPTVDDFFDAIAAERLRRMPADGSRLDGALCRASRLAFAVGSLRDSVVSFMSGADEATSMIWGATLLLLEGGIEHVDTLDSVFGQYGRVTLGISLLLQQESYFQTSRALQQEVALIYAHLLQLVVHVAMETRQGARTQNWSVMGEAVNTNFFRYFNNFAAHWRKMSGLVLESDTARAPPIELESIYQFLELQDRPLQTLLEGNGHSLVDGSFAWFDPHLTTFALGRRNLMLVSGNPGSGKSALAQWTTEKLQVSSEFDIWNVINVSIRSDVPITTLTLSTLKSILVQMLDRCASNRAAQESIINEVATAINLAIRGASDAQVEEQLWVAIKSAMRSNVHFMLVVDGIDQLKHADTTIGTFLQQLQSTVSQRNVPSKLIVFSRPLPVSQLPARDTSTMEQIVMDPATTQSDLLTHMGDMMASDAAFSGLDSSQRESLATAVVPRAQGCFVWAQMAIEAVRHENTFNEMFSTLKKAPNTLGELIDSHIRNTSLNRTGTSSLLSWLAAAERPLRVQEVEQLLAVDENTYRVGPRPSRLDRDVFLPLSRLVMVRDGFVGFRHPMIREHIQARAQMHQHVPFNLTDGHYSLLLHCLAWVRWSVPEEPEVAWDKLNVMARDRYLDAYVLLEYTSRYWLSHMLASPVASTTREFNFTNAFRRAMPESALFARVELTNKESQFSRSSIVELYRLSVAVRRGVLGADSPALLQSLILSARAADLAKTSWANDHLFEAWTRSRKMLGSTNAITHALEQMLVATPEGRGKADRTAGLRSDALRDMIFANWDSSDISFAQRLQYLDRLVKTYQEDNEHEAAYESSRKFYKQTQSTYGPHSSETMQAADFLTEHFNIQPPDELAIDLARTKYETMLRSMDASDPRRTAYALALAQMYEDNKQASKAEGVLSRLWSSMSAREADTTATWDQKTKVAFYYSQFLRRQDRPTQATAILRELSADLEAEGGVRSSEMVQRAEELREEARQMHMNDMERALSLQIWKYYQSNGQEYSTEAVALAEYLAKDVISSKGTVPNVNALSAEERDLLPAWIDSIASAGNDEQTVSLMGLCHQLSNLHIRSEEWLEGSEAALAVLKHVWPSVEDPHSKARFPSDQAPLVATLALDHGYCLFRQLNVPTATNVYGNAFKASITADQVAVPSVTAVVKSVVEFYETTFQFDKALVLLHQVSEFFASRLGENDKHTVDSRYYEADLALRLNRREEAGDSYRHIYRACIRDGKVTTSGVRAAVALVTLYEQEKQYDAALQVYRHLWPTLVRFDEKDGYDRALLEGLLPKTYTGYMSILGQMDQQTAYGERYQVASQQQQLCRKLYGPTNSRTRDATLSLAALCANSDRHTTEAISLYHQVLRTPEWVSSSEASHNLPDMTEPLSISIKHQMAQLYLREKDTSSEARELYLEELALAKQQQGLSAPATLLWLRELAMMYVSEGTTSSRRQGVDLLQTHVDEIVHVTANRETLIDRAHRLAEIYLECGLIDEGNTLINEMHQHVIHDTPASQRQALNEYRPAVFVASFEEVFGKRRTFNQIMVDLSREGQVYSTFQQSLSSHDLMPTLAAGEKLHRLQTDQKRSIAAQTTQDKLYEYFCNNLSVSQSLRSKQVIRQFYDICRRESLHEDYNINIVTKTTGFVRDLCDSSRFQEAADVTSVFHSFVHLTDGLKSTESIFTSIKICLYLNGYQTSKCSNEMTAKNMSLESKMLLQEIMSNANELSLEFSELPFDELNDVITVLGEHEMFEDLEVILTDLWTSRMVQKTWSLPVVVWIGRRLVETRFCRGNVASATQLGKDICYNLRQVWGNCDPVTLEMSKLLSGLYTASGNYLAAAALHETALAELLNSDSEDHQAAVTAVTQHLELLQHTQARLARQGQSAAVDAQAAEDRVKLIATKYGIASSKLVAAVDSNQDVGMWQRPRRFSLDVEDPSAHQNHLRRSSGAALLNGNAGGAKRVSITAL
ncbi:NACHT domain protein [Aspergillus taichungensis]|uniref:NACHT domain protein n=1 Tax=Aspergillus taichungensis TaxID=482145 RepID=A0A2J5I0U9_9EURO|nr:NACHT domain protein [Aspergillus taichungensis]